MLPERYRQPLCPYLMIGNRRVLVHLDAFGVPQSLNWPSPGWPDRLGWRDPLDEWPYWEEMDPADIRARMPFFVYADGTRASLQDAVEVDIDYLPDTNILRGHYRLKGGAEITLTTFVPPDCDVWVRHYAITGTGRMVFPSEFFEKAVRGHALAHMGNVDFRGAFSGEPRGVYVIMSTLALDGKGGRVSFPVEGRTDGCLFFCMANDMQNAVRLGEETLRIGVARLLAETEAADRAWVGQAREPVAEHPFIQRHAKRWLLSLRLLLTESGAMVCGPRPFWSFVWPRDASLVIAGLARAGMLAEARQAVKWLIARTPDSGVHDARYLSDGSPMRLDNRPRQGDNPGLLCWVAGEVCREAWDEAWVSAIRVNLFCMADYLVASRDPETLLPLPEADHREGQIAESIGIAIPAVGGLRGAAWIAEKLGEADRARRYRERADEIRRGAETHLWHADEQYFMASVKPTLARSDIATAWGVFPFGIWPADDPRSRPAIERLIRDRWNPETGGVLCGAGTPYESDWQYHACTLLLGVAGIGDAAMCRTILDSLAQGSSPQGMVPEQVSRRSGNLWGCAPLPTAHGLLLLYAYRS